MNIEITSISEKKIDVTTRDFPGLSEGMRDYITSHFIIHYNLILPFTTLSGIAELVYNDTYTIKIIKNMVGKELAKELQKAINE